MSEYKGPIRYDNHQRRYYDLDSGANLSPEEVVALLNRSIVDAVPEGWRISSVMWQPDWAKDSPPRFVANITKGTGRDIGELYIGTGPTPEAAIADAASKVTR